MKLIMMMPDNCMSLWG